MKTCLVTLFVFCLLPSGANAQMNDGGRHLDVPAPAAARKLLDRAIELTGQDRLDAAVTALKQAIAAAPLFLDAHVEYLRVSSVFLGRDEEVQAEYEALMTRDPHNPVYPMAMALMLRGSREMAWYQRVADEAPEWSWGHYARAFLILGRAYTMINETLGEKGERMLAQFSLALERNPTVAAFYTVTIAFQRLVGQMDRAVATADRMSRQPGLRAQGLSELWGLRLAHANGSEEAKAALHAELTALAATSRDLDLLAAIRQAYASLLKDQGDADRVEGQLRRLDPAWYPERGKAWVSVSFDSSGRPYALRAANRQYAIYQKVTQIALQREPDWRKEVRQYEALLSQEPNEALRKWIGGILFAKARAAKDIDAMVRYAGQLRALDPSNTAPFAAIASTMADQGMDLDRALGYARLAEESFAEFHAMARPPGIPAGQFESRFSVDKQRQNFARQRALALDAAGWVLARMGRAEEAEASLRRSIELERTDAGLAHLAAALRQRGQDEEAQRIDTEVSARLVESVKAALVNRPARDFELTAIDGQRHRLADLKGKVVLVNVWATWCGPCVAEMPLFAKAYEKYKERGLEILAVSDDDPVDRDRVRQFASDQRLSFPVLYDNGTVARLYELQGYPGNVFIDRQGNVRYAAVGGFDDMRRLEIILTELLK